MQVEQHTTGSTLPTVLCCMCGVAMQANAANTCAQCLQNQYDITAPFNKSGILCRCKGCERYQRDTHGWLECGRESRELLAFCLKKIKGLKTVRLMDAAFVWTEEHSRRIKVKLTVQKEVVNGVTLQQTFVVEFTEQNRMCEDCHRSEANMTWNSVVQVRQRVNHKRTFLFLEQLILKHNACDRALKIDPMPMGVDFYFSALNDAVRFQDFLDSVVPIKYKRSKKIISMDIKSNVALFNHTLAVEMVPICKDDILCLPLSVARKHGGIAQVVVATQVTSTVRLIDPKTCQMCELTGEQYWKTPFRVIASAKQLIEFIVLDAQVVDDVEVAAVDSLPIVRRTKGKKRRAGDSRHETDHRMRSRKHALCDVEVAKVSDFGENDKTYRLRSHLGYLLKAGDHVLGYDLTAVVFNDADAATLSKKEEECLPDVVLVRKFFPKYRSKTRQRNWKLKALAAEAPDKPGYGMGLGQAKDADQDEKDLEMFLQDIEEDKELRSKFNLFKVSEGTATTNADEEDDVEEDAPKVDIDELLEDMKIEPVATESADGDDDADL